MGVVGAVVSSFALHRGDPGSIPGFGIQAVWHTVSSDSYLKWRSTPAIIVRKLL